MSADAIATYKMVVQSLKSEGYMSNQMLQPQKANEKIVEEVGEAAATESQHQNIELSSPEGDYDSAREKEESAYEGQHRSTEEHLYNEIPHIERVHNSVYEVPLLY